MAEGRQPKRRMKPLWIAIIGIVTGLLIAEAIFGIWNPVERSGRQFGAKMKELSAMTAGKEMNLTDVTPFAWESVYTFDPYMTRKEMEEILGFKSRHLKETVSEGMQQLVFVNGNEVVCCICGYRDQLGYGVDLGDWNQGLPYQRVDAGFDRVILEKDQGIPMLVFRGEEFEGVLEKVYEDGSARVKIDDSWEIRSSGDRVTIILSDEQQKRVAVGDRVRVTYDGMVMETYPLQLGRHQMKAVLVKPGAGEGSGIDFSEIDFGEVERVKITSMYTGQAVSVGEQAEIEKILQFLSRIKGSGRMSSKGYYEGVYTVELYGEDFYRPTYQIGFGDSTLHFGENEEDPGYPNRYMLEGVTKEDVTGVLGEYFLVD